MSEQAQIQPQTAENKSEEANKFGEVVKDLAKSVKKAKKRRGSKKAPVVGAPLKNRINDVKKKLMKASELLELVERYPTVYPAFEIAWKDANKSVRELAKLLKR